MGNAAFCAPLVISNGIVKVIRRDGRLEEYTGPVKAAELMLENPGQFICDSTNLQVGRRILGLSAQEELERRQLYFILPMEMLYSVLTPEEMSSLTYKATKALKRHASSSSSSFARIFPVCIFPSEARTAADDSSTVVKRYSRQRSWIPALETIEETSCRT
ncbi:PADRE domain [Dillenia turbinata]|uniref:PADRE domain n=1 Tax=Dillenia turbinata TaxID=194707 RepID=A0AAN8Z5B3_9MAGN